MVRRVREGETVPRSAVSLRFTGPAHVASDSENSRPFLAPRVPFPQHARKHRNPPLFSALDFQRYRSRRTGAKPPRAPPGVVLLFGRHRWEDYLRRRFAHQLDRRTGLYQPTASVGAALLDGPGAPYAAIVVEELSALGARRFVIVGIAGSIQPEVRAGSLVICERALRDEGTSHHYVRPSRFAFPSPRLVSRLRGALDRAGEEYRVGPTWTIDAPYRETVPEIRRYRREGIVTVEMEASTVFAVAGVRKKESAALFVISDHLDERGWEPRFHDCAPPLHRALDLALEALSN